LQALNGESAPYLRDLAELTGRLPVA